MSHIEEGEDQLNKLADVIIPRGLKSVGIILKDKEADGRDIPVKKVVNIPMRVDFRKAIHLYISEELKMYIWRLTPSTLKLLYFVMENTHKGSDEVTINCSRACRELELHFTTIYKARTELEKDKWIYRTNTKDIYRINLFRFSRDGVTDILTKYDRDKEKEIEQKKLDKLIEKRQERLKPDYYESRTEPRTD